MVINTFPRSSVIMAEFGDISTVRIVIEQFFRVTPCVTVMDGNELILSESRHLSVVYNIDSCAPQQSWTFEEQDPLIAPFVYDPIMKKYVALRKIKLCLYDRSNLKDSESLKLTEKLHCLVGGGDDPCWAVFTSGRIETLSSVLEHGLESNENLIKSDEKIYQVIYTPFSDQKAGLMVITGDEKRPKYLYHFDLCNKNHTCELQHKLDMKQAFQSFCFGSDRKPLAITGDGEIYVLDSDNSRLLMSLGNIQVLSATSVPDKKTLFIVSNANNTHQLKAINLEYLVQTTELRLDLTPFPNYIGNNEDYLFVGCDKGLLMVPFVIKSISLASVMGKNAKNNKTSSFVPSISSDGVNSCHFETFEEVEKWSKSSSDFWSEQTIFNALKLILTSHDRDTIDSKRMETLELILSRPFNHSIMLQVMRKANLNIDQVAKILSFLAYLVDIDRGYIIEWISLSVDAYFKMILFSKNESVINAFKEVKEAINTMTTSIDSLFDIKSCIEALIPPPQGPGMSVQMSSSHKTYPNYCIEILKL
ncbi:uncharacterized protein LOC141849646 [Brevipalpus obovatus]|uniref:uncharacterized protein LOC141849646 n=1 Tax=Brevipalpus obovatus TaxID=246614 RepID=UPI003D9E33D4